MNPAQENKRRCRTLLARIRDSVRVVKHLDFLDDSGGLTSTEKRRRTLKIKLIMNDARDLWKRNAGLWGRV